MYKIFVNGLLYFGFKLIVFIVVSVVYFLLYTLLVEHSTRTKGILGLNQFYWLIMAKKWLFSHIKQFYIWETQHRQYKLQTGSTRNIYILILQAFK